MSREAGDPDFYRICEEIMDLHEKKCKDYGTANSPLSNIEACQNWGIPPWLGALLRAGDKVARLQTYARLKTLQNESVEDSFIDLASYAILGLVLFRRKDATHSI